MDLDGESTFDNYNRDPAHFETNFAPPPVTRKELKAVVPAHLFKRSLKTSLYYLSINLSVSALLVCLIVGVRSYVVNDQVQSICWIAYWWLQGLSLTGIWVIAHECGHEAFSDYEIVNSSIGYILHSFLLVPYFSWKTTHKKHHDFASHIEKDNGFVPKRRAVARPVPHAPWREAIESSPIYIFLWILIYLGLGWPSYLIANVSGPKYEGFATHFLPSSPLFEERDRWSVIGSNVGLIIVLGCFYEIVCLTSWTDFLVFYIIPYFIVNAWIVTITFLQHTDVYIPKYDKTTWNWIRGSLATVDRDYGWFLNTALHHIQDSHVAHHLFSDMPFYNAIQATPYIRERLGDFYLIDRTPFWKALYRVVRDCDFVENAGNFLFYRSR